MVNESKYGSYGIQRYVSGRWVPFTSARYWSKEEAYRVAVFLLDLKPSEIAGEDGWAEGKRPWKIQDLSLPPTLTEMPATRP